MNHLNDLYQAIEVFVCKTLEEKYLTNPELSDLIMANTNIDMPTLELRTYEDRVFKSSQEVSDFVESTLAADPNVITVLHVQCGDEINLEGWFYNISTLDPQKMTESCISTYHHNGNRHPVLNPVMYHRSIVERMVYVAREMFIKQAKRKKAQIALRDSRIFKGAVLKNITINNHKCSKLEIVEINSDDNENITCDVFITKRGSRSRWTAKLCPSTIVGALAQKEKEEMRKANATESQQGLF